MRRNSALAALADIVGVLVFCAVGRRSHAEGLTLTGVAETAWPFLAGTAVGWLLSRGWRRPTAIVPTGAVVWVCTVAVGMLLRRTTSAGVAFSFLVVASAATAVLLLGCPQPAERAVGQHDVPAVQCRLLNDQRQA
jgi:peptidoglycan/LPS O-acetylase OafA/YrhL